MRVRDTIVSSIKMFIELMDCPIIYICEAGDERHLFRHKLFFKWFGSEADENFKHEQRIIENNEYLIAMGIIAASTDGNFNEYFDEIDENLIG